MDLSGIDIGSVIEFLPKVKEFVEKGKTFLPKVVEFEQTALTGDEKKAGAKVVYSIMIAGEKVFLYLWVVEQKGDDVVVSRELARLDVIDIIESPEKLLTSF